MSRTTDYLDEIKQRQGLTSNYQLAKVLEVSEQDISKCYRNLKHADEYMGTRMALALGIEPIHLLAEIRAEAEKNPKKREFWSNFLRHAAVVTGFLVVQTLGFPSTSEAAASTASTGRYDISANYALIEYGDLLR